MGCHLFYLVIYLSIHSLLLFFQRFWGVFFETIFASFSILPTSLVQKYLHSANIYGLPAMHRRLCLKDQGPVLNLCAIQDAFSCSNNSTGVTKKKGDRVISRLMLSEVLDCHKRHGFFPSFCSDVLRLVPLMIAKWSLLLQASHLDRTRARMETFPRNPSRLPFMSHWPELVHKTISKPIIYKGNGYP